MINYKSCYKCTNRHYNCYEDCKIYKEYRKRLDVIKVNRKKYNDSNYLRYSRRSV